MDTAEEIDCLVQSERPVKKTLLSFILHLY